MSPLIATFAYVVVILGLYALDYDRKSRVSPALWLPVAWLAICCSRMVSAWLGVGESFDSPDQYLEGSPFDRVLLAVLIVIGIGVLIVRRQQVARVLRSNLVLLLFFLYCGVSISWSAYPDVAFKRWVKAIGDLTMVLIVLTDSNPTLAVRRCLSRIGFLLVPLSILFIKYYPEIGRGYNMNTWTTYYRGVAIGKNELGIICLIFGIVAVWTLLQMWGSGNRGQSRIRPTVARIVFLAMVFWLFSMADSMTSQSCFIMATILMLATRTRFFVRKAWAVHALVASMLSVSLAALFLSSASDLVKTMGRDPTLTGRTDVWKDVLAIAGNRWFGTGFESFWLGWRIQSLWDIYWWRPNEAHNGYLEVYLNLGWVGVALLAILLIVGYRSVIASVRRAPEEGQLRLAFFYTALAYNCTESAVRIMHPVWIILLLAAAVVPGGWGRNRKIPRKVTTVSSYRSEEVGDLVRA